MICENAHKGAQEVSSKPIEMRILRTGNVSKSEERERIGWSQGLSEPCEHTQALSQCQPADKGFGSVSAKQDYGERSAWGQRFRQDQNPDGGKTVMVLFCVLPCK